MPRSLGFEPQGEAGKEYAVSIVERVFEELDASRDDIITIQRGTHRSCGPGALKRGGPGEHEKSEYIFRLLRSLHPDSIERYNAPDERAEGGYRPNLAARWSGSGDARTVWVLSHSDIVPPGDASLWNSDPYTLVVDGDRLIGRGVEDNQHGFVSSYLALKAVRERAERPVRGVGLLVVADEETGSEFGLRYVLAHAGDMFKPDDLIVVPDAGNEEGTLIEVAEKSMLWIRFTVTGRQCHASTPHKGRNSLVGAAAMIMALARLGETFPETDDLFSPPRSTFEPTKMGRQRAQREPPSRAGDRLLHGLPTPAPARGGCGGIRVPGHRSPGGHGAGAHHRCGDGPQGGRRDTHSRPCAGGRGIDECGEEGHRKGRRSRGE